MGRSQGVIVSVKVPITWDMMTRHQKTTLNRITGRDTRVIKGYLGIIEQYESELVIGKKSRRINAGKLDELTLTASKGAANRLSVPHDFKTRFTNMSVNEFQECRDTAIAMWQSYLERGGSKPMQGKAYSLRKLSRVVFRKCFKFVYKPEQKVKHWIILRDSLNSVKNDTRMHDALAIPLSISSYHLNKFKEGELKTLRILKDRFRKWWISFTVTVNVSDNECVSEKPPAILGIDLGINKAACSVLLTQKGHKHIRYWKQEDKLAIMTKYDQQVASLQRKKEYFSESGKDGSAITKKLRTLSRKRKRVSFDYDRKFVKNLSEHIFELSINFSLYVVMGKPKGIRAVARKGNGLGTRLRGKLHRWSFARVHDLLEQKLTTQGFDAKRYFAIPEGWTSILCHRCGRKGTRPKQSLFICHTCGYRTNADMNGAVNIGRRIITLIPSLTDETIGLGMWLLPKEKTTPKARRKTCSSKRKSSSPERPSTSKKEVSVADCCDQALLAEFESSNDSAMAKTVKTPSAVTRIDTHDHMQRTETRSKKRSHTPMTFGKACSIHEDTASCDAGDSKSKKGGTQKSLTVEDHSLQR